MEPRGQILQIEESILDRRFLDHFETIKEFSRHIVARFILRQVLEMPSFLVNEEYLLARLGIDKSSTDVKDLFEFLDRYKYKGIFCSYYKRWWMPLIQNWWDEISPEESLRSLTAEKRVQILKKVTSLRKLKPILKDKRSASNSFWTVCKGTGIPIDTIDGLMISSQEHKFPWQEKEYVSIQEALRPQNPERWKGIAVSEKNRLQNLKEVYGQTEKRVRR
jgi:hypothetical protein